MARKKKVAPALPQPPPEALPPPPAMPEIAQELPELPALPQELAKGPPSAQELGIADQDTYNIYCEYLKCGEVSGPGYILEVLESVTDKADFRVYERRPVLTDGGQIIEPGEPVLLHIGPAKRDGKELRDGYQFLSWIAFTIGNTLYPIVDPENWTTG